ncbi:SMI1/KNR4 family protein [Tsukamurella sp. 1534]|uniref:SMI1/KNR4 family protein n=1 Tax=Tsukamurella sp. 1534 TaxID=1151061 RepID=UPI0002FE64D1|nr:SMI1/KNR4 family protein [Tsukamurella sp. 1534]
MDLWRLWQHPPLDGYLQPMLTVEALRETERELGVRLPEPLVGALGIQNGGLTRFTFPAPRNFDVPHSVIRGIGPGFWAIRKGAWWHTDPTFAPSPDGAEWLIPFDGGGHWDLCLDYRRSAADDTGLRTAPSVVVVDTDRRDGGIESLVAPTFDEYLSQLVLAGAVGPVPAGAAAFSA